MEANVDPRILITAIICHFLVSSQLCLEEKSGGMGSILCSAEKTFHTDFELKRVPEDALNQWFEYEKSWVWILVS